MYLLNIQNIMHHKTCVPCWPDLNPQHCARLCHLIHSGTANDMTVLP